MQFSYGTETISDTSSPYATSWSTLQRVTFYNKSTIYCNEAALVDCASVSALPTSASFATDAVARTYTITPPGGPPLVLTFSTIGDVVSQSRTGVSGSTITYTYDHLYESSNMAQVDAVQTVTKGTSVWTYQHLPGDPESAGNPMAIVDTIITDPATKQHRATGMRMSGALEVYADGIGGEFVGWSYD